MPVPYVETTIIPDIPSETYFLWQLEENRYFFFVPISLYVSVDDRIHNNSLAENIGLLN